VSNSCRPHSRTHTAAQLLMKQCGRVKRKHLINCLVFGRIAFNLFSGGRKLFWRQCLTQSLRLTLMCMMDNYTSEGFFCAFGHCLEGFHEGCRQYLSVDSTALNERWNGHLPSATSVDGHNWMFLVAFRFFEYETYKSWSWFLLQLRKTIGEPLLLAIHT
jgi:hypothetical protein